MTNPIAGQPYVNLFEQTVPTPKKKNGAILVGFFLLLLAVGVVHYFYNYPVIAIVEIAAAFLLGILYALRLEKSNWPITSKEALVYSILLTASIFFTLCLFYFFAGRLQLIRTLSFSCAFILPYIIKEVWRSYAGLPNDYHHLWYYSQEIPSEPLFAYLETKRIKFKVIRENWKPKLFSATIPTSLSVGVGFYYMLKEKDKTAPWQQLFMKEDKEPYGWTFYISRYGLWKKYLEPEDNLVENNIRSGSLIIAKRIS